MRKIVEEEEVMQVEEQELEQSQTCPKDSAVGK